MNRRDAITAAGASILAGATLTTSAAADDQVTSSPRVGDVETKRVETRNADEIKYDEYTVNYVGDGRVEITGYTVAPTSCYEVTVNDIHAAEYGDVVDLELVPEKKSPRKKVTAATEDERCSSIEIVRYSVELEYKDESLVPDVFVQIPDGKDVDGIVTPA